jgi:hypothetical protein
MAADSTTLIVSSISIYTIVRFSIFLIPLVLKWNGAKGEELVLKNEVSRIILSVEKLTDVMETTSRETLEQRKEIFVKLKAHDEKIEYIERDIERLMNNKKDY